MKHLSIEIAISYLVSDVLTTTGYGMSATQGMSLKEAKILALSTLKQVMEEKVRLQTCVNDKASCDIPLFFKCSYQLSKFLLVDSSFYRS